MRFCPRCKTDQPVSNFRSSGKRIASYCLPCDDEYRREWHKGRGYEIKKFIYDYRKNTPCVDCGIVGDPIIVEFDHIRGDKRFNVAHAFMKKGMTIEIVKAEIDKCEMRCRNCHAKVTQKRSGSWIWEMFEQEQRRK